MNEIQSKDYIISQFKEQVMDMFKSNVDMKARKIESQLNCKISIFKDLRTSKKRLTLLMNRANLERSKNVGFSKVLHDLIAEENDSIYLYLLNDLYENLECKELKVEKDCEKVVIDIWW